MDKLHKINKHHKRDRFNRRGWLRYGHLHVFVIFVAIFSVLGYMTLHVSHAATTNAAVAAAAGGVLSGEAATVNDSSALNGRAVQFGGEGIHYVALGDSVASGEGINYGWTYSNGDWNETGPENPTWEPTTDLTPAVQDCHRSAQAYPYLIAGADDYQLLDLSCSGSSIPAGVLGPIQFNKTTAGQAQLGYSGAGYSPPNTTYDTFKPDLVTITLGMDDVDFTDVLSNCYTGACGTTSQDQSMDAAITTFSTNLKTLLAEIDSRGTADGKVPWVVLTTYYDPFNIDALSCDDINIGFGFGLSSSDVSWLQSKLQAINQAITAASSTYPKAKVVDLSNVMAGHQFCSTDPWAYGPSILYDDPSSPAPFHPTPNGQQAIANAMLTVISSLGL